MKRELVERIKRKNEVVIAAFEKVREDIEADRKGKVLNLVALALKNIHRRTGLPIKKLEIPAAEIIKQHFTNSDDVFTASATQLAHLNDDAIVKDLIKQFFIIRQFNDLKEISGLFRKEIERFRKRALIASALDK